MRFIFIKNGRAFLAQVATTGDHYDDLEAATNRVDAVYHVLGGGDVFDFAFALPQVTMTDGEAIELPLEK